MLASTREAKSPERFTDIPGINDKLLEELDTMDWKSTRLFDSKVIRDNMEYVSETPLPMPMPSDFKWRILNSDMEDSAYLSRTYTHEIIQFGYSTSARYYVAAACEISDLSDQLSRDSTLEDVKKVLGSDFTTCELGKPTIFTEAQTETAYVFFSVET